MFSTLNYVENGETYRTQFICPSLYTHTSLSRRELHIAWCYHHWVSIQFPYVEVSFGVLVINKAEKCDVMKWEKSSILPFFLLTGRIELPKILNPLRMCGSYDWAFTNIGFIKHCRVNDMQLCFTCYIFFVWNPFFCAHCKTAHTNFSIAHSCTHTRAKNEPWILHSLR